LLLMGMYEPVIDALHQREIGFILIFMAWAAVGLLSFVRVVKYFFSKHHDMTIAALIGLMLWSLPKLRPRSQAEFVYTSPAQTPGVTLALIIIVFVLWYAVVKGISHYSDKKDQRRERIDNIIVEK
jgi:putative membrane protein